ncbi:MAG: hypothetical protein M3389_12350, partial [Actinomycetota bacterium]|nr:hypothetical protein [Actinomycetota bacterium]
MRPSVSPRMGALSAVVVLAALAGSTASPSVAAAPQSASLDPLAARPLTTLRSGPAKQKAVPTPRYDDATVLVRFRA